jgi:Fe(II)/alpha-ketoglutarate-dependent arginine beta-hydroxylase
MDKLQIDAGELQDLTRLLDQIENSFESFESDDELCRVTTFAHQLPRRIRDVLNSFRLAQMSGVLCISGYIVEQERIGPTPGHWRDRTVPSAAHREELLLLLFSSLLGDPFCWATQQNGRLIHDVLPIKGHENEQLGSSSEALLTWHTEDAFHPLRGDFLSFACLRNPYGAATTIGYVDSLELPDPARDILFQERFSIRPDESHLAKNNSASSTVAFSKIDGLWEEPQSVAVLFGDPDQPYIRADPYFMTVRPDDQDARHALDLLVKEMDARMLDLRMESGDFCFLDNFRTVHGRKPFKARHNGTDRWLKRVNITCDLRKSRAARPAGWRAIG